MLFPWLFCCVLWNLMFWDAMGKIANFVYFRFCKKLNSSVKLNVKGRFLTFYFLKHTVNKQKELIGINKNVFSSVYSIHIITLTISNIHMIKFLTLKNYFSIQISEVLCRIYVGWVSTELHKYLNFIPNKDISTNIKYTRLIIQIN